jgi:Raf kinase inhibitor-like YbhB/YbcL family protein
VLYNLPAETVSLPEIVPGSEILGDGRMYGKNSWGQNMYGGPCPPGGTHRYVFKLYALDTLLDTEPGLDNTQLLSLMEGHILSEFHLMGPYSR